MALPSRSRHHASIPSLSDAAALLDVSLTSNAKGNREVVKALSSTPRGHVLGTLIATGAATGRTTYASLSHSASLLPAPGPGGGGGSGGARTCVDGDPSAPATCVAALDWNDHHVDRSIHNRQHLSRWLSSLGSVSSLHTPSVVEEMGGKTSSYADRSNCPAFLAVGFADGNVTLHIVTSGQEERVSTVVAVTKTNIGGDGESSAIAAISFIPMVDKQKKKKKSEEPIRIAALTKSGDLILLEASETISSIAKQYRQGSKSTSAIELVRDTSRLSARSDETQRSEENAASVSLAKGEWYDHDHESSSSLPFEIKMAAAPAELVSKATISLASLCDSSTTGALAVGRSGNGTAYVAAGINNGVVLIYRPPDFSSADGEWIAVETIELPSAAMSLAFSTPGNCAKGYGDAPMLLCAGQADGEVALLDATSSSGLDEQGGGMPTFQPFHFIEAAEAPSLAADGAYCMEITSVDCHRDWTKQGAGRLLVAIASGSILRILDGSAFEVCYQYDFGVKINDIAFVIDRAGSPRVVVAKDDGVVEFVGMRCWDLLLEGSEFLKLHEIFHPAGVPSPFLRRSSTGKLYNEESVSALQWACGDRLYDASGKNVMVYDSSTWNLDTPPHASAVEPSSAIRFGLEDRDVVVRLASSVDGKYLAAAVDKEAGGCHIYSSANGDNGEVFMRPTQCEYPSTIKALEFSPDSQHLLIATCYACIVYKVDTDKGVDAGEVKKFDNGRDSAVWSRDGKFLAIGAWSKVMFIDTTDFSEICSIDIGEPRVTTLAFDAKSSVLAIGQSDKCIALAVPQEDGWTVERTIAHQTEVNYVEYSPDPSSRNFLVLGVDHKCHIYSTVSLSVVQVIKGEGMLLDASWHPSGAMLALAGETKKSSDALRGDVMLVRVGEVLNPGWYPLLLSEENDLSPDSVCTKLNGLSNIDRAQLLYHNATNDVFPLAQSIKAALEKERSKSQKATLGSTRRGALPPREEVTTFMQAIFLAFPRAVFGTRDCNGKSIFELAIIMDDPRLLKLAFLTALVGCRAHSHLMMNDDFRSGFLSKLLAMSCEKYPDVSVDIIHKMALWPVPTLELLDTWKVQGGEPVFNVGSSPAAEGIFDESLQVVEYGVLSRPMVLPLPGLCSLPFLSAMTSKCPAEVFNQEEVGLILDEIWFGSTRTIFLLDFTAFLIFFMSWSALVTTNTTADDKNTADNTCAGSDLDGRAMILWGIVFLLNVAFGVRELRQLRSSSDDLLGSIWETMEGATQAVFEHGTTYFLETKNRMQKWAGVSRKLGEHVDDWWNAIDLLTWCMVNVTLAVITWRGSWTVECAVITSFMLLLKLLSYLRGFDDCGWLLVVLYAQFQGAQGFIVVIFSILLGFAVCFNLLLGPYNEAYETFGASLFSMFDVGVLGDFDSAVFKESANPLFTMALFVVLLVVVLIVAMSGFVLILESALEEVRENEDANRRYQRSRIVIDYLKLLSSETRARVSGRRKYFFALVPVDHDDVVAADDSQQVFLKRKMQWKKRTGRF